MVNSGKRKYTKKTIMSGGAIEFSLIGFSIQTPNGIVPAPAPLQIAGNSVLYFIDGTQDTFFNTFRRVKFSKSSSTCYLVNQGTEIAPRLTPYQLIYRDGNVFQYAAYDFNRFRLVQQNSQMSDEQAAIFLSLPEGLPNSSFSFTGSGRAPGAYREWASKLEAAIREGNISIDQLFKFFYNNGNKNRGFKVDINLQRFWNAFYIDHHGEFF
jgi:hypothetical protein